MSTYEELSATVDELVKQAILAEMRHISHAPDYWYVDNQDNPTTVTYTHAADRASYRIDMEWSTGHVTQSVNTPVNVGSPAPAFLAMKHKWEQSIPQLFDRFLGMPDPSHFATESTNLNTTGDTLNGGGFKIGDTEFRGTDLTYKLWQVGAESAKMVGWSGPAATTFRDRYLKTWPGNLSNQFAALCLMKISIDREQALWTKSREQIALTADHAVEAMKAVKGPGVNSSVALAIFSAVSGLVSMALPVAGQVTLAVIGGALSIADAAKDKPEERTMEFGAASPDEVYTKIDTGLNEFSSEVWDAEYAIRTDLKALQDKLHERTAFIGTGADDLVGSTDPYDVGVRGDQFEVSEVNDLRSFAQICIDASADAHTAAGACTIPSPSSTRTRNAGLGYGYDGPSDEYANCAAMLQDIIADNGIIIGDAGVQLDGAANTYLTSDQDSHNRMQDRSQDLTDARKDDQEMPSPPPPPPPPYRGPGHPMLPV